MTDANGARDLDELPENPSAPDDKTGERPTAEPVGGFQKVRPAGIENIPDDDAHWDEVDQAADETFPASDPPGQGVG